MTCVTFNYILNMLYLKNFFLFANKSFLIFVIFLVSSSTFKYINQYCFYLYRYDA